MNLVHSVERSLRTAAFSRVFLTSCDNLLDLIVICAVGALVCAIQFVKFSKGAEFSIEPHPPAYFPTHLMRFS